MTTHTDTPRTLLVGLGATGLSVARHLQRRGEAFAVWDEAPTAEAVATLRAEWPEITVHTGTLDEDTCCAAATVIVSPGVSLDHPALRAADDAGVQIYGDIELFARVVDAPVLGITGSNGKSTTTRLLCHLLTSLEHDARCGGNLGPPALSLLADTAPDVYVLELSSFQLEATHMLPVRAGVVLNLTPDHLDRHGSFERYREIKLRLYRDAEVAIYNRDDPHTQPISPGARISFGLDAPPQASDFGICAHQGADWFCHGSQRLAPCDTLPLPGLHNRANALAALAVLGVYGVDVRRAAAHLATFTGLDHRLCRVAEHDGIRWFDDSKATNYDAMAAALTAFDAPCVLLAGGQAKKDNPQRVADIVRHRTRQVVVFGEAASDLAVAWADAEVTVVADVPAAVAAAKQLARRGDCVLLSPGCASFDHYTDYRARGADFLRAITGEDR